LDGRVEGRNEEFPLAGFKELAIMKPWSTAVDRGRALRIGDMNGW
jgi:hypothetical protein